MQHTDPMPTVMTVPAWQLPLSEVEFTNTATLLSPSHNENIFEFPQHPFNLPDLVSRQPLHIDSATNLHTRVNYCVRRLSLIPNVFALSGQTMFIHRQSFQTYQSPALQQAMSACALYCTRTPATNVLVHQVLQRNVQHLLSTTDSTSCSTPDLVAALQALLLYQLMRLFDGDIRLRAAAEDNEITTILWASELRTRACALSLPLYPVATLTNPEDWHEWLFNEGIRRTVVTTFLLCGGYNYLKTGSDSPTVVGVYFTAQGALWNAQSEVSWNRAKEESLELQVMVNEWDEVMAMATPGDLEELGVLVMSMLWGLQSTQSWLGYGYSTKYGLEG
jgi:hypothetical protein